MSADSGGDSGGSTNSTEPRDVPNMTNPVQEAEHEVANSCSKLAVNPNESFLYQSPRSASVTASLLSGRLSTMLSIASSLAYVKEDEQEHQNEDATQYSEASSQDTLEEQDVRMSLTPPGEDDNLHTPIQAEEIDKETLEMVITKDYITASLMSTYFLIEKKEEVTLKVLDDVPDHGSQQLPPSDLESHDAKTSESMDATALFTMDDDEEPTQAAENRDDSPSSFISSLNFAKTESESAAVSNLTATAEMPKSSANHQKENKAHTPESVPTAAPNLSGYIDRADQHRDPTPCIKVDTGGEL